MRRNPDGTESPYELNISYFSALADPDDADPSPAIQRFLASQAVMLALQGIPGIYFPSLLGTPNDLEGVARTGRARSINRRKFELTELETALGMAGSIPFQVLEGYHRLLETRMVQPAFHPDAPQQVIPFDHPALLGFLRVSLHGAQKILVLSNLGPVPLNVPVTEQTGMHLQLDLLDPTAEFHTAPPIPLAPYQVAWFVVK